MRRLALALALTTLAACTTDGTGGDAAAGDDAAPAIDGAWLGPGRRAVPLGPVRDGALPTHVFFTRVGGGVFSSPLPQTPGR